MGSSPTEEREEREVDDAEGLGESKGEFPLEVAAESAVTVRLVVGLGLKAVEAMVQDVKRMSRQRCKLWSN